MGHFPPDVYTVQLLTVRAIEVHEIKQVYYISGILEFFFWKLAKERISVYCSIYNVFRSDPVQIYKKNSVSYQYRMTNQMQQNVTWTARDTNWKQNGLTTRQNHAVIKISWRKLISTKLSTLTLPTGDPVESPLHNLLIRAQPLLVTIHALNSAISYFTSHRQRS